MFLICTFSSDVSWVTFGTEPTINLVHYDQLQNYAQAQTILICDQQIHLFIDDKKNVLTHAQLSVMIFDTVYSMHDCK